MFFKEFLKKLEKEFLEWSLEVFSKFWRTNSWKNLPEIPGEIWAGIFGQFFGELWVSSVKISEKKKTSSLKFSRETSINFWENFRKLVGENTQTNSQRKVQINSVGTLKKVLRWNNKAFGIFSIKNFNCF